MLIKGGFKLISLCGRSSKYVNHYRCITSDITANAHLPNAKGCIDSVGVKLVNGDELAVMDGSQDVYLFDEENQVWIKQ